MSQFEMLEGEDFDVSVDFDDRLPNGTTIASCTVTAENQSTMGGSVSGVLPGGTTASVVGSLATIRVAYGDPGEDYKLTFLATLNTGRKIGHEVRVTMAV